MKIKTIRHGNRVRGPVFSMEVRKTLSLEVSLNMDLNEVIPLDKEIQMEASSNERP